MSQYFIADTHFNHAGVVGYCNRPFADYREMNRALIALWNEVVRKESDDVWVLGDFAFAPHEGDPTFEEIFYALRGRKHLIVGNHDERNPKVLKLPWETVDHLRTFRAPRPDGPGSSKIYAGRRAELCHYPLETWKGGHHGALMLHGHSHGSLKRVIPHRFDVGVDALGKFGPVDFEYLWELAQKQTYEPQDHHEPRAPKHPDEL